ncbi:hypothetical protein L4C54_15985 [Vibrio lamellibrachiae]|uniref:hypothetical protein n=1 Tax=Vibrio lamellibrachiae TaxID=2910253 RepID=UPI003D0CF5AA
MNIKCLSIMALSTFLIACGGGGDGDSSSGSSGSSTDTYTYTAIDGLLGDAEVWVDRNGNLQADDGEYAGLTDANGEIQITEADAVYDIIVKVISGQTTDTDVGGVVNYNKEMIAVKGQRTITPFSTLAKLQGISLSDLAAILNLSEVDIAGNYVANDAALAHAIARSLQHQLGETLSQSGADVVALQEKAGRFANHLASFDPSNLRNVVIEIDGDGNLVDSTISIIRGKSYVVPALELAWEQTNFSGLTYAGSFHPCYTRKWGNVIIVSDCASTKLILLDMKDGTIVAESDTLNGETWFVDGLYIGLLANSTLRYLNRNLEPITPNSENLKYNTGSVIALGRRGVIKNQVTFAEVPYYSYRNQIALDNEVQFYDESASRIRTFEYIGELHSTVIVSVDTVKQAIYDIAPQFGAGGVSLDDYHVEYIYGEAFVIRLDTSGSDGYVSNDYHFMYTEHGMGYLGQMYQGHWYFGLDRTSVSYYSTYKGAGNENHIIRQFDLVEGQSLGVWTKTMAQFPPNLYGQEHTTQGIIAVSDSYSTVLLLK